MCVHAFVCTCLCVCVCFSQCNPPETTKPYVEGGRQPQEEEDGGLISDIFIACAWCVCVNDGSWVYLLQYTRALVVHVC